MSILLLAINAVAPIFIMMVFGYFLKYKNFIGQTFIDQVTKLVFRFALPAMVFLKIATIENGTEVTDAQFKLLAFVFIGILIAFIITTLTTKVYHNVSKESDERYLGAMNQGSWRTNYLIVGFPVLYNLYGDAMVLNYALITIIAIPFFNVLAVYALTHKDERDLKQLFLNLVRNPLIIAVALGFGVNTLHLTLPSVALKVLEMVGGLATPLGLIAIGAFFHFDELKNSLSKASISVTLKLIVFPIIATTAAYFLGFSQMDIIIMAVLFGGPASVSSFAMSKEMGSDATLAGNIVIISSALCAFTYMAIITFWLSIA